MNKQLFNNTGKLISLQFRQNKLKLILWLVGIAGLTLIVAAAYPGVYQTEQDMADFGVTMQNPAMESMLGPAYELEAFTNSGVILASEMLLFTAIGAAIMNILIVGGTTRKDEAEGRLELIRSLPVGKLAYLMATLVVMVVVNVLIVVLIAGGLILIDESSFPVEGAWLYASVIGLTGLVFAGITAVAAQLAETSRDLSNLAFGALILAYIVRAVGDVSVDGLSYFSPLGWSVQTDVFASNEWWPILALTGGFVVLTSVAFYLNKRRDIFAGILPTRSGRRSASKWLQTLPGLVWHLEKTKVITWTIGMFLMTMAFGSIFGELETYFTDLPIIQDMLAADSNQTFTEQFMSLIIAIMSLFSIIPGISIIYSLKNEEKLGRTENMYSRAVSRTKVLATYYGLAALTTILIQLVIALGFYLSSSQVLEQVILFANFVGAAMIYLPALWLILGITTLIIGLIPKFSSAIWLYVAFTFIVLYTGELLELPKAVTQLSVFDHIPQLPGNEIKWPVLITMMVTAVMTTMLGFIGYNCRDI